MKYIYKDKDGSEVEVQPERWGWGVVYHPTADELAQAEGRGQSLKQERAAQLAAAMKAGEPADKVEALAAEYDARIAVCSLPIGDELHQFSPAGYFHQFGEIDQARVRMFTMYRLDDMGKRIDIAVRPGMQIFHFYRNFGFDYMGAIRRERIYCFGWKDKGAEAYHYILPDDRIVMGNGDVNLTNFNI